MAGGTQARTHLAHYFESLLVVYGLSCMGSLEYAPVHAHEARNVLDVVMLKQ
jgi:hypothetical protein